MQPNNNHEKMTHIMNPINITFNKGTVQNNEMN